MLREHPRTPNEGSDAQADDRDQDGGRRATQSDKFFLRDVVHAQIPAHEDEADRGAGGPLTPLIFEDVAHCGLLEVHVRFGR